MGAVPLRQHRRTRSTLKRLAMRLLTSITLVGTASCDQPRSDTRLTQPQILISWCGSSPFPFVSSSAPGAIVEDYRGCRSFNVHAT